MSKVLVKLFGKLAGVGRAHNKIKIKTSPGRFESVG